MKHSYPTSESLKFLLEMVHNREMALQIFNATSSGILTRRKS